MSAEKSSIKNLSEQELTKSIGQFLYQSIKEEWLTAYISLSCLSPHQNKHEALTKSYVCTAYYTCAFNPEHETNVEDKLIENVDAIKPTFEQLFTLAQEKSGKVWAEAIFTIERSGKFNLKFVDDTPFDGNL
ncbi:DUF600 family protein [Colwellia sp. D2M02]|uniref:DUF600 family protein n=1 Tax=Colwellia asteriadis TaxID=517723 RepID=A0ABP3WNG9_9GAMM|nr:immunity protein YezG family protein [Colwellia sp. D2M02]MBU2894352.1 DUF600 family protein [Colwellia sp. D2M02]